MTLNLDIPQAIEQQLIQEANLQGVSLDNYLVQVLKRVVKKPKSNGKLSESELLKKINLNIAESEWTDYKQLTVLRRAETINEEDYQRLLFLGDKIEVGNAERFKHLIALAQLRQVSLDKLMADLGIKPVSTYQNHVINSEGLKTLEPDRKLYLAVPEYTYSRLQEHPFLLNVIAIYKLHIVIYNIDNQLIISWIE